MTLQMKSIVVGVAASVMAGLSFQAAAADIQDRNVKFSYAVSQSNPVGLAVKKFIETVDQKTDGKIKITGFSDAQLGNEIQSMSSAQGGIIELSVISSAGAASNVKELGI